MQGSRRLRLSGLNEFQVRLSAAGSIPCGKSHVANGNGTSCITVFFCLNCVLRWSNELSEFLPWHSWSEKLQENYIVARNRSALQKGFTPAESRRKMRGKGADSGALKHPSRFFYFETTSCFDFSFFVLYYLFFLLQRNINFKKSKSKQNVSVSIITKLITHLAIH